MKRIILFMVVMAITLVCAAGAQACLYTDRNEYIVVFRQGVSWEHAAAEVQSWGSAYHLATITSRGEQKYLQRLLRGLRGEFWVGGYHDSANQWRWVTDEPWDYTRWAKGEPDSGSGRHGEQYLAIRSRFHGAFWEWRDEWNPKKMAGFIVEREITSHDNGPVVPIPAAVWLFGSGLVGLAGFRLARRTR